MAILGMWTWRLRRTPTSPRAMSPRGSGFSSQKRGMMEAEVVSPGYLASGEASRVERARLLDEDEMSALSLAWRSEEELEAAEAREMNEREVMKRALVKCIASFSCRRFWMRFDFASWKR